MSAHWRGPGRPVTPYRQALSVLNDCPTSVIGAAVPCWQRTAGQPGESYDGDRPAVNATRYANATRPSWGTASTDSTACLDSRSARTSHRGDHTRRQRLSFVGLNLIANQENLHTLYGQWIDIKETSDGSGYVCDSFELEHPGLPS
jgi:hypothetical protein